MTFTGLKNIYCIQLKHKKVYFYFNIKYFYEQKLQKYSCILKFKKL
jgi:hypothetical protein